MPRAAITGGAAWCAGWLGFHLSARGDLAQASGWFGRASRLLEHERQECAEHGYLLTSVAFQQLMAGDYVDAQATAKRAAEIGGRVGDADLVAFGLYLQGRALVWDGRAELYRLSGDFAAAEDAYQQASRWGRQPQPGLALLRLVQGKIEVAAAASRRVVGETSEPFRRARLLPAHVEIMLTVGDLVAARDAATELTQIADAYGTPALRAMADHARGAVLLTEGDAQAALVVLRAAWEV
jgi:tetratricopeptide (TPR) repeat protein